MEINIICLIGRSSSGKDTIKKRLIEFPDLDIRSLVPVTTRPIREGETRNVEYVFYDDDDEYLADVDSGKIMESRAYDTAHGIWRYGTPFPDAPGNYVVVCSIDQFRAIESAVASDPAKASAALLMPFYIYVEEGELLTRALEREKRMNKDYDEMCRRFRSEHAEYKGDILEGIPVIVNDELSHAVQLIVYAFLALAGEKSGKESGKGSMPDPGKE